MKKNDETMNIMFGEDEEAETNSDVQLKSPFTHPQAVRTEGALGLLNDRFIVLRIMEYCHYDWFREAETTTKRRARAEAAVKRRCTGSSAAGGSGGEENDEEEGNMEEEDDDDDSDGSDDSFRHYQRRSSRNSDRQSLRGVGVRALMSRIFRSYRSISGNNGPIEVDIGDLLQLMAAQGEVEGDDSEGEWLPDGEEDEERG